MLSQWRAEVTFFTSVWVILHVAFGALLRVASSLQWLSAIIKRMLDIRGQPMLCLAAMGDPIAGSARGNAALAK
jgi:hypothetical protein